MTRSRVAIGGILTECNHFGGILTDMARFEQYELCRGEQIMQIESGVVGGMLQVMRDRGARMVPLVYASTCPGGPLTASCYSTLKTELLDRLRGRLPVDGVLLAQHGAAAVEDIGELDGDLVGAVRDVVGPAVPIVATLDLHAHVTAQMVRHADALLAWETYPHRDAFTTGQRGARMLADILDAKIRPTMAMAMVPVIVGGVHGSTEGDGPFADIMRAAKSNEQQAGVLSTSVFLVYPYHDLPEMGGGGLVITDDDMDRAVLLAREIAEQFWARRFDLEAQVVTPHNAIARGSKIEGGHVLLVEAADCCGGGAAGDSVATLSALLEAKVEEPCLVPVVDPDAAAACHRAGEGRTVTVDLGHKLDSRWGRPIRVKGQVSKLSDGTFRYAGGIWDNVEADMGPSALLSCGAVGVLITTHATYDWADEQFRAMGIDPAAAKFIVAKNPMNFRIAYGETAKATFILDTPGPTPATVRHVRFKNLKRPYFPLDEQIPGLVPNVLCSHSADRRARAFEL